MATDMADSSLEVRRGDITDDTNIIEFTDSELSPRILALPLELQDHILWLTHAFDIPAVVKISEGYDVPEYENTAEIPMTRRYESHYVPPVALQLNHDIREKFARKYYSSAIFECITGESCDINMTRDWQDSEEGTRDLIAWLSSLSAEHKRMIKHVRIIAEEDHSRYDLAVDLAFDAGTTKRVLLREAEFEIQGSNNVMLYVCVEGLPPLARHMLELSVDGERIVGNLQPWAF